MIESEYLINQVDGLFSSYATQKEEIENANEAAFMNNAEYADIKYQFKACVFDLQKAKAFDDKKNISRLEKREKDLTLMLGDIKKTLDIKEVKYVPHCHLCNDTGYYKKSKCLCYYKTINTFAYNYFSLKSPTFYSFDDNTLSDKKTIKRIEIFKDYCNNFNAKSKNIVLLGHKGTGKTFFAEAISNELINKKKNVLFLNAFQLNDVFLKIAFSNGNDYLNAKDILITTDLLVIDDFGAAPIKNNITIENLLMIISERQALSKPYIVTTNLSLNALNVLDERVFSRMCGKTSEIIYFDGADLRLQKQ